jgi:hypothetical protein
MHRISTLLFTLAALMLISVTGYAAPTSVPDTPFAVAITDSYSGPDTFIANDVVIVLPAERALMPEDGSWQGCVHCADCYRCPPPVAATSGNGDNLYSESLRRPRATLPEDMAGDELRYRT